MLLGTLRLLRFLYVAVTLEDGLLPLSTLPLLLVGTGDKLGDLPPLGLRFILLFCGNGRRDGLGVGLGEAGTLEMEEDDSLRASGTSEVGLDFS